MTAVPGGSGGHWSGGLLGDGSPADAAVDRRTDQVDVVAGDSQDFAFGACREDAVGIVGGRALAVNGARAVKGQALGRPPRR